MIINLLEDEKKALQRVCDDAERWNAQFALSDPTGFRALSIVRLVLLMPLLKGKEISE